MASAVAVLLLTFVGAHAGGPGTYAHYEWPPSAAGHTASAMEVEHYWAIMPNATETQGNAVFASTQFWFAKGPGGYMGTQAWLDTSTGAMTHRALFSCWDFSADVHTGWVAGDGGYCARFGGEGVGAHCIITYPLRARRVYAVRVAAAGHNASGAMWRGTITDVAANETTVIGTLFFPNAAPGAIGYGDFSIAAADFQEYFLASGCEGQAVSSIGLSGPTFTLDDGSALVPEHSSTDYAAGCAFSDVTSCIPGVGCGKPHVLLTAGGATTRTVPAGAQLW